MRVLVIKETVYDDPNPKAEWKLWFQWCKYVYDKGDNKGDIGEGYRFIWRRPNGHLQPARGQARIPSIKHIEALIKKAKNEGWGNYHG